MMGGVREECDGASASFARPAWQPIGTAPSDGNFLAENMHGDWMVVRRFDPGKPRDFSANAVINGRTGRWWYARLWMPLLTARDEFPENLADAPKTQSEVSP